MSTEDVMFFSIAALAIGGISWLTIWAIGRSRTILHDPYTYVADASSKQRDLSSSFFDPVMRKPLWLRRIPHLKDTRFGRSLLLASTNEILIHGKARFFWEIMSPQGPTGPYVVHRHFQVLKFTDIDNYAYSNESADGWTLRFHMKNGESKVYTHCANNDSFKQTMDFIAQQLNR